MMVGGIITKFHNKNTYQIRILHTFICINEPTESIDKIMKKKLHRNAHLNVENTLSLIVKKKRKYNN